MIQKPSRRRSYNCAKQPLSRMLVRPGFSRVPSEIFKKLQERKFNHELFSSGGRKIATLTARANNSFTTDWEMINRDEMSSRPKLFSEDEEEESKIASKKSDGKGRVFKKSTSVFSTKLEKIETLIKAFKSSTSTFNHKDLDSLINTSMTNKKTLKEKDKKKKRRKHKEKTAKAKLTERILYLHHNEDEVLKLKANIKEFERRMKLKKIHDLTRNYVEMNKKSCFEKTKSISKRKKSKLQNEKRRRRSVKDKKLKLQLGELEGFSKLESKITTKIENAARSQERTNKICQMSEQKMKLSYLVVLLSRTYILEHVLAKDRLRRYKKKKFEQLKKFAKTRIMPYIYTLRSKRWNQTFVQFRKYFNFFQLWIVVKKKKESVEIIKKFLSDSNKALKLVRQVHLFSYRIKTCQHIIRKYFAVNQTREQFLLLRYKIVESKILLGKQLTKKGDVGVNTRPANVKTTMGGFKISHFKYKHSINLNFFDSEDDGKQMVNEDQMKGYVCYVVPNNQIKLKMIREYVKKEVDGYEARLKKFESDKIKYDQMKKKNVLKKKIDDIWDKVDDKEESNDEMEGIKDDEIVRNDIDDENKPQKPILRMVLSEQEIFEKFVISGFKQIREKETNFYNSYKGSGLTIDLIKRKIDLSEKEHTEQSERESKELRKLYPKQYKIYNRLFVARENLISVVRKERKNTYDSWRKTKLKEKELLKEKEEDMVIGNVNDIISGRLDVEGGETENVE